MIKMDPPEIVPPGPTTSKYLDPPVQLLYASAEVFRTPSEITGPPWGPTTSKYLDSRSKYFKVVPKYLDPQCSKQ